MSYAHTPGPWEWLNYPDGRKLLMAPGRAIIHCPGSPMSIEPADARLIASAPAMLAACEIMLANMEEIIDDGGDHYCEDAARRDAAMLRAVLTSTGPERHPQGPGQQAEHDPDRRTEEHGEANTF